MYYITIKYKLWRTNLKTYKFSEFSRPSEYICLNESMYNHGLEIHNHDFFEITFILKGKGLYTQNRRISPISEGDVVMVSPEDIHRFEPLTHDFRWINCIFLPDALEDFTFPVDIPHEIFLKKKGEKFKNLFTDMKKEYIASAVGYKDIMNLQLKLLLTKISYEYTPEVEEIQEIGITDEALRLLVQSFFYSNTLYSKITLEELAKKAHITPKYFSELFKKKTGQSLSEYLKEIRLERAAELLLTTDANISEIIRYIGYSDSKFFYKEFKNKFNMTPAAYRRSNLH